MSQASDKILPAADVAAWSKTILRGDAESVAVWLSHEALRRHVADLERQLSEAKSEAKLFRNMRPPRVPDESREI